MILVILISEKREQWQWHGVFQAVLYTLLLIKYSSIVIVRNRQAIELGVSNYYLQYIPIR